MRKRSQHIIHPSIDSLFARIAAIDADTSAEAVSELRAACSGKIHSYPLDTFMRTKAGEPDARLRYEAVARFAAVRRG